MPKKDGSPTAAEKRAAEANEESEQFPSLDGNAPAEIAQRSADETEPEANVHTKQFVVLARDWHEGNDEAHRFNIEATRQAMISTGLRPTGDGKFVGSEDHPDGASLILTYEVPARPAVVATDETVTHAHVTLADQHAAESDEPTEA